MTVHSLKFPPKQHQLSFALRPNHTPNAERGSLIPRPFPLPVFDRFQYKNGGGRPGRVTCVTSCRREGTGRREGGGARSL